MPHWLFAALAFLIFLVPWVGMWSINKRRADRDQEMRERLRLRNEHEFPGDLTEPISEGQDAWEARTEERAMHPPWRADDEDPNGKPKG